MAATIIRPVTLARNTNRSVAFTQCLSMEEGFSMEATESDHKLVLLFWNTAASGKDTVTLKKGDGPHATKDLLCKNISAGAIHAVPFDSAYYKVLTGEGKGNIYFIPGTQTTKAAAILL